MTLTLRANSDLVATAWIGTIPTISAGQVATTLPADATTWGTTGFITARTVGGPVDLYLPAGRPVVQVDCWGVNPTTEKPLWGLANALASTIVAATRNEATLRRLLTLPNSYPSARVIEAYPLIEPRRIEDDPGSYARYSFDLQLHWVEA